MRRRVAFLLAALVAACGNEISKPRYSADVLADGVSVDVNDPDNVVQSATVFLAGDLSTDIGVTSGLGDDGVVVVQPGPMGYDAVVVYRTGPYCGLLPDVDVRREPSGIEVEVRSQFEGDCDAMQYDEALGLELSSAHKGDVVAARHQAP